MSKNKNKLIAILLIILIISSSGCATLNLKFDDLLKSQTGSILIVSAKDFNSNDFDDNFIEFIRELEKNDSTYNKTFASDLAFQMSLQMRDIGLESLDADDIEDFTDFKAKIPKINRIIEILNENTEMHFEKIEISEWTKIKHGEFITIIRKGEKYVPIISSYNELIKQSENVIRDKTNDLYVRNFYIAAFLLGVDVCLIETGAIHKGVFKSVGSINNEFKLAKVVPYCGYSGYGFILSNIYWSLRGYIGGFKNDIYDIILEIDDFHRLPLNLNQKILDYRDVKFIQNATNFSYNEKSKINSIYANATILDINLKVDAKKLSDITKKWTLPAMHN